MKHTEIALERPVTTVVVFVALALVGLLASRLLPLEKFPDIEFPGIFIQIPYEGSTPEEVERLITRPVEESLATLSGVEQMFSTSREDQMEIFLQFDARYALDTLDASLEQAIQHVVAVAEVAIARDTELKYRLVSE